MAYKKYRKRGRKMYRRKKPIGQAKMSSAQYPAPVRSGISSGGLYKSASSWINRAYSGYGTAVKAYKLGSLAMSMLNAEKKYYDISQTTTNPSTPSGTYTVQNIFDGITVGDGPTNRDGYQIRVKSLCFRFLSQLNASATSTRLRFVIFLDRRPQIGSAPVWTDLFDSSNLQNSFYNLSDQWKRFKIITDKTIVVNTTNLETQTDIFIPMSLPVRYNASGQSINNNMWFFIVSDEITNTPQVSYRYRVRFYDN